MKYQLTKEEIEKMLLDVKNEVESEDFDVHQFDLSEDELQELGKIQPSAEHEKKMMQIIWGDDWEKHYPVQ